MITPKHLNAFILALDEKRFYDAHEVLEELWFAHRFNPTNEVKLLKGFINASVSFELIKRGRVEPAKKPWETYLKYKKLLLEISTQKAHMYDKISKHIDKTKETLQI